MSSIVRVMAPHWVDPHRDANSRFRRASTLTHAWPGSIGSELSAPVELVKRVAGLLVVLGVLAWGWGCGSDGPERLFPAKAPCNETPIVPLTGQHQMVISSLEIGSSDDGFDLDGDGETDNRLAALSTLARGAIEDQFETFSMVIPLEFFDFPTTSADDCAKLAVYLGQYALDGDRDGSGTAGRAADCNDHDAMIHKGAVEVADNFKDDDCDGLADEIDEIVTTEGGEMVVTTPSANTEDLDGDGVTMAAGDCDDTNDAVRGGGAPEVCGDGYDNDCDGNADYALDDDGAPVCTPYDDADTPDDVLIDPLSFGADGAPVVAFQAAAVTSELQLTAGPSLFAVGIPVTRDLTVDLRITGATIEADLVMLRSGLGIANGHLGGVIDAATADTATGLDVEEIGLTADNTLLDAVFADLLGTLLGLPAIEHELYGECQTPDIDVDRDGLEAFCDSNPLDDRNAVDVCIDGDGTIYRDEVDANGKVTKQCTEMTDDAGNLRFVDGVSVELNFEAVPAVLPAVVQ